ncbi:Guanylate cyclase 32E [Frankliniella fusca]|uniref:Guanylate cyclase n=1 Tax=Frankliniella fusca TaxID=407009 RepID=A0AAE1LAX5_9NEOP|nr:Guanylate cyclase 32E [Frankliniella fusca]
MENAKPFLRLLLLERLKDPRAQPVAAPSCPAPSRRWGGCEGKGGCCCWTRTAGPRPTILWPHALRGGHGSRRAPPPPPAPEQLPEDDEDAMTPLLLLLPPLLVASVWPAALLEAQAALMDHGLDAEISSSADMAGHCKPVAGDGGLPEGEPVTLGFLGAYGQTQVVLGALPLAVRTVNMDPRLLPGRRLQYLAADIGTNPSDSAARRRDSSLAALALRVMTVMRDRGAVAFIGPDDTCGPEALVAAAWNLPVISYNCADARMSDKRVYHTFARTLPPASKVSKSVVALLRAFGWGSFVVVAGKQPAWSTGVKDAIEELARTHGFAISDICEFSDYIPRHIEEMEAIVDKTYETTRVYVFVGEHVALVDFVKVLHRRGLLEKGEYVVISVDDEIYDPESRHKIVQREYIDPFLRNSAASNAEDAEGFRSVLKLTPAQPSNPQFKHICEEIKKFSTGPPFCVPYHHRIFNSISVPIHAAHLYDAILIYARALTEVLARGEDPRNGSAILQRIRGRAYHSVQGFDVLIDDNGDAEGNFSVVAALPDDGAQGAQGQGARVSMQPVGYFAYNSANDTALPEFRYFDSSRQIQWVSGTPPRAEPLCGFHGERCAYRADWRLSLPVAAAAVLLVVAAAFALKHYRYEQKLACLLWKVDSRDITLIPAGGNEAPVNKSMVCRRSVLRTVPAGLGSLALGGEQSGGGPRAHTHIGLYKGNIVAVKYVYKRSLDLTRSIRKELKQIREVRHENLIPFIGACVDQGALCILTAYCARGSLEDVLANEDLHLDNMFVSSLVADILKGMIYLHDSDIVSHGNLRSSNCLVDSRWVLQISDFGLHEFKAGQVEPDGARRELRRCLWRAPELLRAGSGLGAAPGAGPGAGLCPGGHHHHAAPAPPGSGWGPGVHAPPSCHGRGTQKGDVYSFGILLYEVLGRAGPWGRVALPDEEVVARVVAPPPPGQPPFRPDLRALEAEGTADSVLRCMEACWSEDPEQRPDIRLVRVRLKEMQAGLKPNIFDNMLSIMEKYAYNLEGLVQERTNQLSEEKKKTEALLHRMLPKTVTEALKRGDPVEAESFDCVTIYFSDIVGFTELSAVSTPLQVVDLLNDLYTCCDSIISHYDVYKVETIGDAYMVASGLPVRNGDRHAGEIASMALRILSRIRRFEVRHRPGEPLQLRVGIHSGHCVAGVVGLAMPRYCLFGDTVNTASRMESSGLPHRIHISEATHALLQRLGGYHCEERGVIAVKGKGDMRTWWLVSEDPARRMARLAAAAPAPLLGPPPSPPPPPPAAAGPAPAPAPAVLSVLSETPDLLRRPAGGEALSLSAEDVRPDASELHRRALEVGEPRPAAPSEGEGKGNNSELWDWLRYAHDSRPGADLCGASVRRVAQRHREREHQSAPVVSFTETSS